MDNTEDHASIDIKNLATSLRKEFKKLYALSDECCIYKVSQSRRQLNAGLYNPKVVSIGPLHHGREELKAMEEFKIRYLQDFLQRTKVSIEEFLNFIKDRETRLRNCYAETIKLGSDEFVKMILLDSVFLIEYSLRKRKSLRDKLNTGLDRIFTKPWMSMNLLNDMFLLENQLPLFILEDLFNLAKREMHSDLYEGLSMNKLICDLWKGRGKLLLIEDKLFEEHFPEAQHFVDLIRLCLQPSELRKENCEFKTLVAPTITELQQAGVSFKLGSSNHLFDIRFKDGTLEIPKLTIDDKTETLIANLQDLETLSCQTKCVIDYVVIMNYLVNSPKDVEVLAQNGIIENWLSDSEDVSTLFQNLQKETNVYFYNFYYSGLIEDLKAYCKSPWHKWKATLKQNYFNTPWASISVIAAVVLLILTIIQTVFTVIKN